MEAECGYHALFNALSYYRKDLSLPTFIQENKRSIQQLDDIFDGQWLSEDQLALLLQNYKTDEMNVTIIPDIFMYQDGHSGLERSVLEGLANAQQAATTHPDGYKHIFLLGTMNGRANNRMTHWFAVAQIIQDGEVYYEVMNSLPSYSHKKQVVILQDILHNKGNRYNFAFFDVDLESELEQAISQLNLVTILEQTSYARKGESGASVYRIVDKTPTEIIDAVVHAANLVLELTDGNQFWSTSGAIDPKLIIQDALITIKNSVGTALERKENSTDKEGLISTVELTIKQEQYIAALEKML